MVVACNQCPKQDNCTLIPLNQHDPCYSGPRDDVQALKLTDPLVQNTTVDCGNCPDYDFKLFYRNDVRYPSVKLYTISLQYCVQCVIDDPCLILPPISNKSNNICSQGNHLQVQLKYDLGPQIAGRNISCGYCKNFGFPQFYRYDRLYSNITEWIPESSDSSDKNEGLWSSGKGVIIVMVIAGVAFLGMLILLFRKSIWNNSNSKYVAQQSLIPESSGRS